MRFVGEHASLAGCDVAVFGPGGEPISAQGELASARPSGLNGCARVENAREGAAVSAVVAFDRLLGYVVAVGRPGGGSGAGSGADAPRQVAEHGAAVLAELASREYELNDLSREILGSYEELNLFYDLAGELAGASDPESICRLVLAKACSVIQAAGAWIALADGPRGALRIAAANDASLVGMPLPSQTGRVGVVMERRASDLVDDVRQLDAGALAPLERAAVRSLVTVSLSVAGHDDLPALGVLQLRDKKGEQGATAFTAGDLKLAQAIASQAAALIQNSRLIGIERELKIARNIQQSLLPGDPPDVPGLDVAGMCTPASNVGGDYYDHLPAGERSVAFLVADVSGHNLAAALLQTAARAAFRAAAIADPSPQSVMERASLTLHDDLSRADLFLTAWFGCADAATGELAYSDAGHNPALLCRAATGAIEELATGGIPIGVMADAPLDEKRTTMHPGDVLLVYTDGITEACAPGEDGEQFGEERLAASLARNVGRGAADIVRAILEEVARFSGDRPAGDDRSLVVLKFTGRG